MCVYDIKRTHSIYLFMPIKPLLIGDSFGMCFDYVIAKSFPGPALSLQGQQFWDFLQNIFCFHILEICLIEITWPDSVESLVSFATISTK